MHFPLFLCLYESFWKGFESACLAIFFFLLYPPRIVFANCGHKLCKLYLILNKLVVVVLAFISRAAGSTDTMFWKVTLSSALIFSAKDICTINFTFLNFICIWNCVRSVSFSDGGSRDCYWHNIQRSNVSCILFSWLRGEVQAREANSWPRSASSKRVRILASK